MENEYTPVIRQGKLSIQVADQIQQLILSRDLKPGDRLPTERDLGETFGVSRTVIREAIRTLEAHGLVVSQTGSGTYVRAMQGKDVASSLGMFINSQHKPFSIDALMEVRRVLEIEMVKLAAQRATSENIQQLENNLDMMVKTIKDIDEFSRWDLEFHLVLADACGNQLFGIILEPLTESLFELIWTGTTTPGAAQDACRYHRAILDCVKKKDSQGAAKVMRAHLDQAYRVSTEGIKHHPKKTR